MARLTIGNMTEDDVAGLVAVLIGAEPSRRLDDLGIEEWDYTFDDEVTS
jgi:hypothetical protein